ncbi:hypothetical protein D9M71_518570 [compost metagenome]
MCSSPIPTFPNSVRMRACKALPRRPKATFSGSATIALIVIFGFSEAYGFWNTILKLLPRALASVGSGRPSTRICPLSAGSRPSKVAATVLLPQPDSPTSATVSPTCTSRLMWSMAVTRPSRLA